MADNNFSLDLEAGSSQYSSIADGSQSGLDLTASYTFEAWLNLESLPATSGIFTILAKRDGTGAANYQYEWLFRSDGSDQQFLSSGVSTGSAIATQSTSTFTNIGTGEWHHYAVSYNQTNRQWKHYIDTVNFWSSTPDTGISTQNSDERFYVGTHNTGSGVTEFFDGKINNLRVWSDVRSDAEIAANWKTVLTNTGTNNLVDVWYYDNTHNSASGNNNLTATNAPVFSTDIPFVTKSGGYFFMST